jgi:hypothetical protein
MGRRAPARLSAAALALAAALAGCRAHPRPLARGAVLDLDGAARDEASLVWVVPAGDFRVCGPVAGSLRRLQATAAAPLPLTVAFVGPHPEWMAAYLRSQRLRASLVALTPGAYTKRFGAAPFHALYGVRGRRVAEVVSPDGGPEWEARLRAFAAARIAGPGAEAPPGAGPHR